MRFPLHAAVLALSTVLVPVDGCGGCNGGGGGGNGSTPGDIGTWPILDGACDPLVPEYCGFPFPSDAWLAWDASAPSGRRVAIPDDALPRLRLGGTLSGAAIRQSDGWSPGAPLLAYLPGLDSRDLTNLHEIAKSVTAASTTLLINTRTGALVPHFAEVDQAHDDDNRRALVINPAVRLDDATRYVVVFHGLKDIFGAPIASSEVFAALRDGSRSDDPSVDTRRGRYNDIFSHIDRVGIPRQNVQLAWDFTTASQQNNTSAMLHMRDDAFARIGNSAPGYSVTVTEYSANPGAENYHPHLARRIDGTIQVPLYLDKPGPGGRFVTDGNGLPRHNGSASYPFLVTVPHAALASPGRLVQFGHGLFGTRESVENEGLMALSNKHNIVFAAMDWIGMSREDVPGLVDMIQSGDLGRFNAIPDRSQQGFLNNLVFLRALVDHMKNDGQFKASKGHTYFDPTRRSYYGGSLGGIYGASYMALSQDLDRGVLAVPGQSFAEMLPRSTHFGRFYSDLESVQSDPRDTPYILSVVQMLWDRADPVGYAYTLRNNPLPGTHTKDIFAVTAVGDHQVANYTSRALARSIGLTNLTPAPYNVYGLPTKAGSVVGAGYLEVDFGLAQVPLDNMPPTDGPDPHNSLYNVPVVLDALVEFVDSGVAKQPCGGVCRGTP